MAERALYSIHGIRTDGRWQIHIEPSFRGIENFAYDKHNYGEFPAWKVPLPSQRDAEVERFATFFDERRKEGVRPSIIAHSFGTWIVCTALQRFPVLEFDRMVLCGSVVDQAYDWSSLFETGRVNAVLNERAGDDDVVRLLRNPAMRAMLPGSGPSGLDGFHNQPPRFREPHRPQFRHSDHFILRAHCDAFWRPFIFGNEDLAKLSSDYLADRPGAGEQFETLVSPVLLEMIDHFYSMPPDAARVLMEALLPLIAREATRGVESADELTFKIVSRLWWKQQKKKRS